jgi:hypothetical protein
MGVGMVGRSWLLVRLPVNPEPTDDVWATVGHVRLPVDLASARGWQRRLRTWGAGTVWRAVIAACVSVLAACSGAPQPHDTLPPTAASSATSSGSESVSPGSDPSTDASSDPQAAAAVGAYIAFWDAANEASRHPLPVTSTYPASADFTRYSFDPIRAQYVAYLGSLAQQGVRFSGTPPVPRVEVSRVSASATPYPTVSLTDCQASDTDWHAVVTETGRRVPDVPTTVAAPYLITAKLIYFQGHWGLQSTSTDTSRTCTA